MPFPKVGVFGIVENPLVFTPFGENNSPSGMTVGNNFLLMYGEFFLLMDGTHLLLMGS